ncbi:HDOD domain-containing protein [Candidatus Thiodiazotropha sp. CDECU1]|uniref:HDOD domain-containing protein n=1 Tax=Candidatus Thiodiazotropha sp. CDECU1 TaxID=3065865 RepID=UPI00292DA0DF|nr:HDOD domain-containing protein [Candidatus Thiodiazotropha sp. CDECU1]
MNDIAFEFVQQLGTELSTGNLKLPAFPDVAVRVKQVLESDDVSADKVAKVVGSDPVLTARLLKVANSNFANRSGAQIKDLRTAVARLGYDLAYSTAVSIAVEQIMDSKSVDTIRDQLKALWQHSVNVSAIAYVIAKNHSNVNPDEAMLAGLLHDIGKYYIYTRAKDHPELFDNPESIEELQKNWHTGIGHAILEAWHFSDDIANTASDHDDLQRVHLGKPDVTDVIITANLCAYWEKLGDDFDWDKVTASQRLNLDHAAIQAILEASGEEIQSIMRALGC